MKIIIKILSFLSLSSCKNCYNKKKTKYNNFSEKLLVNVGLMNNLKLVVGPSYSGKTFFILKDFSRLPDRNI